MQKSSPHDISQDTFSWLTWARLVCVGGIAILAGIIEPVWAAASDGIADNEVMSTPDEIPNLFLIDADQTQQHERSTLGALPGRYAVRLNPQINAFSPSRAARFLLPQGIIYDVVHDNQMIHPSGSVTWVGYLKDYGDDYRVLITTREGRSFGWILTPDGEFLVESDESGAWLVDVQAAGLMPAGFGDDIALPPQVGKTPIPSQQPHKQLARLGFEYSNTEPEIMAQPQAAGNTTIDVMLLYTSGMANRYGAGLQARLDSLIALANQAYIDSQVNITLRLVYSAQVNYSDTTANSTALDDLTNNAAPTLTQVNSWRDQYGADLVALLRPYNIVNHGGCGLGWLNGFNGTPISGDQAYGYAVVSDGSDIHGSNSYCYDLTLTHELGHTMGSTHERANAGGNQGAFPYSYGYGFEGVFGTIMSYIHPPVAKFSNPNILCAGSSPCGLSDYADNARSLNNTRGDVATFRATQVIIVPHNLKLAGINSAGYIYYTSDLRTWVNIPGYLSQLQVGDLNGDGQADLAGVAGNGTVWYTTDLRTWVNIPGYLSQLQVGDLNGDGQADLAGVAGNGTVWYTTDLRTWVNIPGYLSQLQVGDLNGDGRADLAGVAGNGTVWYTTDLRTWVNIPGYLSQLQVGDLNGDGRADLAGVAGNGTVWYTTDLRTWVNIPGYLSQLQVDDLNSDGRADLAGVAGNGTVWYTTDLRTWVNIPGYLSQLQVGDLNGDGRADLAGVAGNGTVWYTTNLLNWVNIPGYLSLLAGD